MITILVALTLCQVLFSVFYAESLQVYQKVLLLVPCLTDKGTQAQRIYFYFEISLSPFWEFPSPLFSARSFVSCIPFLPLSVFISLLLLLKKMNENKNVEAFMSEKCFILILSLIGSLAGYRNSILAIIFLQNFEGIAPLFSAFFLL